MLFLKMCAALFYSYSMHFKMNYDVHYKRIIICSVLLDGAVATAVGKKDLFYWFISWQRFFPIELSGWEGKNRVFTSVEIWMSF